MSASATEKERWPVVAFGDVVKPVSQRVDPAEAGTDCYVGLEHLDGGTLTIHRHGHPDDVSGQKLRFYEGDVIFGKRRAYQRKLAVARREGICSAHAMVLRANPEVMLPEFLPFFMQSDAFMERAVAISVGSLSPTINWKTLKSQKFPLPPLNEQRRIARLLWAADEAVEELCSAHDSAEAMWRSSVEAGLRSHQDAEEIYLRDLWSQSPSSGYSAPEVAEATGCFVLSLAALTATGYVPGQLKNAKPSPHLERARLRPGDLLVSRSNTPDLVGFAGTFDDAACKVSYPDLMFRLSIKTDLVVPRFLELVLLSNSGRRHMRRVAAGTSGSMKKINQTSLGEMKLLLPPLPVQEAILIDVDHARSSKDDLVSHMKGSRSLASKLLNELLEDGL